MFIRQRTLQRYPRSPGPERGWKIQATRCGSTTHMNSSFCGLPWPSLFDQSMASPASRTSHSMFQIGTSLLGLAPAQTYWLIRFAILEPLFTCSNMSVIYPLFNDCRYSMIFSENSPINQPFWITPPVTRFWSLQNTSIPGTCGDPVRRVSLFPFPLPHLWRSSKRATGQHIKAAVKKSCRSSSLFPTYFPHISHFVADQSPPLENQHGSYHPISLPFGPILWHGKALYHLLQERQNLALKTNFVAISVGVYGCVWK